jgi:hypothetical protein
VLIYFLKCSDSFVLEVDSLLVFVDFSVHFMLYLLNHFLPKSDNTTFN